MAVRSTDGVLIVQRRNRDCGGVRVLRDAERGAGAMLACGVLRGAALKRSVTRSAPVLRYPVHTQHVVCVFWRHHRNRWCAL